MKGLAALFLLLSPAWAGDLGIADMQTRASSSESPEIFSGLCGGPLSDTKKKCSVSFINGRLVTSAKTKLSDDVYSAFEGVRGITPSQIKSISWHEPPNVNAPQEFVNEIIYESSEGKWTRAGFSFSHGDQVRGFYSALMRWMSKNNAALNSQTPADQKEALNAVDSDNLKRINTP